MDATKHLSKNKKTVEKLANELLSRETLTGAEIREIVFGKKETKKSDKKTTVRKNVKSKKQ